MEVLNSIYGVITEIDGWLWGLPLIIILVGTHLFMTIRTKGIQRKIFTGIKLSFTKDPDSEGDVSPFAALTTALSATVGTGNIIGVATAIISGGVGAIFWMWIIGILGIATKYAESFISVKYRVKDRTGQMLGGAMYALRRGFKGKTWAKVTAFLFALFAAIATFGIGGAVQSNSTCGIINEYLPNVPIWVIGLIAAVLVGIIIFGGLNSLSKVCEKLVPFMAIFYVICCIIIIGINGAYLLDAIKWIVVCAFTPKAMVGGGVGFAVASALRFGAARGLFSNEAGLGSAPLVDANATCRNPARQALVSMTGVFWDTVVICLVTGLTLVTAILANPDLSAAYQITNQGVLAGWGSDAIVAAGGFAKGLKLTVAAFNEIPVFGPIVLIVGMCLFSFTTMLGWSWYGNRVVTYLFGEKAVKPYQALFLLFIFLGAIGGSALIANLAWDFADIMNGLMAIPNCIAIWALSRVIAKETNHYVYDDNLDEKCEDIIPYVDDID
jgi:alanine or glycine:cation symporter, AGCS family